METDEKISLTDSGSTPGRQPVRIEPDLDFIRSLSKQGGDLYKKCMQCGTCSATCTISPDPSPFPSKEMAWAVWGMKDQLVCDPDVWLCYQCHDCSTRCPRGARPGDVLAAVRQESIIHHTFPRFLGRWASVPQGAPFLLGIPAALFTAALYLKEPLENWLGISTVAGDRITFAYSTMFPRWMLNSIFLFITALVFIIMIIGAIRFWNAIKKSSGHSAPINGLGSSIFSVIKDIFAHKNFSDCTTMRLRYLSHMGVFFGFLALTAVTIWVITSGFNPLIRGDFVYPFSFWNPWKILANLGGLAILGGILLMIRDRAREDKQFGNGSYFDWAFITTLLAVVLSGFATEILHYVRLEPHRHIIYFVHLIFAGTLILYLPYSKFAHMVYRTVALVYAESRGRNVVTPSTLAKKNLKGEEELKERSEKR